MWFAVVVGLAQLSANVYFRKLISDVFLSFIDLSPPPPWNGERQRNFSWMTEWADLILLICFRVYFAFTFTKLQNICSIITFRPLAWVARSFIITFFLESLFSSSLFCYYFSSAFSFTHNFAFDIHAHIEGWKFNAARRMFFFFSRFSHHSMFERRRKFSAAMRTRCLEPLSAAIKNISRAIAPLPIASHSLTLALN